MMIDNVSDALRNHLEDRLFPCIIARDKSATKQVLLPTGSTEITVVPLYTAKDINLAEVVVVVSSSCCSSSDPWLSSECKRLSRECTMTDKWLKRDCVVTVIKEKNQ